MNYVKINDETEYIYWSMQNLSRPAPVAGLPRDKRKENELYFSKGIFRKNNPSSGGWKTVTKIPMYDSILGIHYQVYCFSQNHKNAFVAAQYHGHETLSFALPKTPVFCYQEWLRRAQYVVFSDNPLLADSIQKHLNHEPLWMATSFLQKEDLKDLDFSIFSGKNIIYYLVEHSGNSWKEICFNADDVIDRFPKDTEVYVVSFPEKDVSILRSGYPVFLSSKQSFKEEVERLKNQPANLSSVNWNIPKPPKRQEIAEGFQDKTLTWVYDASAVLRTQYLTHWAVAISQGKANMQGHIGFTPRKTAYIYVNDIDDGFISGVQTGSEDVFKKKFTIPSYPNDPNSISEVEHVLTHADLFLNYPVPPDPFFKFYPNFYYTSFWPLATLENDKTSVAMQLLARCIDNLGQHHSGTEILILDIPSLWTFGIPMTFWAQFLYDLRSRYSVILATNTPAAIQKSQVSNLPFDKIIRIQRHTDTTEGANIDLVFERDDIEHKKHTVRLTKGPKDRQWRHRPSQRLSVEEKIKYIKQHKGIEIKEVAIALGVSISYVKKLRGLAGVSKKVPSRAPKNSKVKLVDYSI